MGLQPSKIEYRRTLDEGTSSNSLSNVRYVEIEKPKWKVFRTREIHAVPFQPNNGRRAPKTCNCGQEGTCKQKITPCGVAMHYPQKSMKKRIVNLPNVRLEKDTIKCQLPPVQRDNGLPKTGKRTAKDMSLYENPDQPQIMAIQTGETQLAVQVEQGRHSLTLLIDVTKLPDQDGRPRKLPHWRVDNMECNGKQYKISTDERIKAPPVVPNEPVDPNDGPDSRK